VKKANDEFDKLYKETITEPKKRAAEAAAIKSSSSFYA